MEIFNQTSYKNKNRWILISVPIVLILLWIGLFSRTYKLYTENQILKEQIRLAETAPQKIAVLKTHNEIIEKRFKAYSADSIKSREYLLQIVSSFCKRNNIILKEFPVVMEQQNDFVLVQTNLIVAEGSFSSLLRLLYELEQVNPLGRPSSVSFFSAFDNKRKRKYLSLKIYLQNISLNKNASI